MSAIVADTHTIVWYLSKPTQLSQTAAQTLDQASQSCDHKIQACPVIQTIW